MSRSKNSLARWWGFALVIAVLAALPSREVPAAILFVLSGLGLVWATRAETERAKAPAFRTAPSAA